MAGFHGNKKLEKASISKQYKSRAESLVKWFNDHRDFVIQGAWYPDSIIKDMATSHILKYKPNQNSQESRFRKLPSEYQIYEIGKNVSFTKNLMKLQMEISQIDVMHWLMGLLII
jgi:hypothetical protein